MTIIETKTPQYVHCANPVCGHEWILFYTPIPADEIKKFAKVACPMCYEKKVMMGHNPAIKPFIHEDATNISKITTWLCAGRDTGISSKSLAAAYLGTIDDMSRIDAPYDPADLGRCLRLIALVPDVRQCVDKLAETFPRWAKASACWDAIAQSMEDEVGINWEKGHKAPLTYNLMKERGL